MAKKPKTIVCDVCSKDKPRKGSVQYGCYTVCKECDEKPINISGDPEDHDPLGPCPVDGSSAELNKAIRESVKRVSKQPPPVYPLIRYSKEGHFLEVILEQKEYYGDEIHPGIVLYRSQGKDKIVGFSISGLKRPKWMKKHHA